MQIEAKNAWNHEKGSNLNASGAKKTLKSNPFLSLLSLRAVLMDFDASKE